MDRPVIMLVQAGAAVDELLAKLETLLEPGDIIIDGGNEMYKNTQRRLVAMEAKVRQIVGGEEEALYSTFYSRAFAIWAWESLEERRVLVLDLR